MIVGILLLLINKAFLSLCKWEKQTVLLLKIEAHQASKDISGSLKSSRRFIMRLSFVGIEYNMIPWKCVSQDVEHKNIHPCCSLLRRHTIH